MEQIIRQPDPFCRIVDLQVAFYRHLILKRINLSFPADGITVIIGPSGSGKTTLLRSLNRLNEQFQGYSGCGDIELMLNGFHQEIHRPEVSVNELRRRVGMVFQTPNLLPSSIAHNILLPLKLVTQQDKSAREDRMHEVLQEVHLWDEVKDRLREEARRLSGGQQQRLCLARTLALKPEILLLDEPTASLDYKTSQRIEALLCELQHHYRIVAVSHSLRQAAKIAKEIVVMSEGRVVYQLKQEDFSSPHMLQQLLEEVF